MLDAAQKAGLQALMWPDGKLSSAVIGQSAAMIARRAGFDESSCEQAALAERVAAVAVADGGGLVVEVEGAAVLYEVQEGRSD